MTTASDVRKQEKLVELAIMDHGTAIDAVSRLRADRAELDKWIARAEHDASKARKLVERERALLQKLIDRYKTEREK